MALRLDPEYEAAVAGKDPAPAPFRDVFELRNFLDPVLRDLFRARPTPEGVHETRIPFASHDGAEVQLHRFATRAMVESAERRAAVVYAHGGGFIKRMVAAAGMPFFAVDYRLAPEFSGGVAAEDVFHGLRHLSSHAAAWTVDAARIVLMGDSAGGGAAAGAALLARDWGLSPPLRRQVLVYPMLDDRTSLAEGSPMRPMLRWTMNDSRLAWRAVLGEKAGRPEAGWVPLHAAPGRARARDLRGLPKTYVDVGSLDLFRDECIDFVGKLARADVEVEFHVWPGLPHGFEGATDIGWVKKAREARNAALRRE
ncbi:alpha/beta-hydrolase [Colletotrichum zoysiae]|uniref:Alpha/beta-hydrolase n=1 Tax=Colletotrichum zoysiae TaxID=1216348 RepID=A0AAD9H8E4_9PEZI|nr:alpha/beta-hydrolase [Colletotrichum zoysiae]